MDTSDISWSPEVAYAVGLMATDGNLSGKKGQMSLISKDLDQIETMRRCLRLGAPISQCRHRTGRLYHRVQWCDRGLYNWFLSIGLTPAKSLTFGPIDVPDEFMADFVRGCIDGDGSIRTCTDRYNVPKKDSYIYERLYVSLVSASSAFVEWIRVAVKRTCGVRGSLTVRTAARRHPIWCLKYAKRESERLLAWLYYSPSIPCLARKRIRAKPFLPVMPQRGHRGMLGTRVCWGSGEAGNRVALKTPCPQGLRGSSPLSPTNSLP